MEEGRLGLDQKHLLLVLGAVALLIGDQGMVEGHAGRIAESPRRSVAGLSGQKKFRRAVARAFFQNLQRFMARTQWPLKGADGFVRARSSGSSGSPVMRGLAVLSVARPSDNINKSGCIFGPYL